MVSVGGDRAPGNIVMLCLPLIGIAPCICFLVEACSACGNLTLSCNENVESRNSLEFNLSASIARNDDVSLLIISSSTVEAMAGIAL